MEIIWIRDGKNSDPGWVKNHGAGSGMGKKSWGGIRDKHPGSATLQKRVGVVLPRLRRGPPPQRSGAAAGRPGMGKKSGSGTRNGKKFENLVSGINIPDPQHCKKRVLPPLRRGPRPQRSGAAAERPGIDKNQDPGSGMGKREDPGSGIKIPDPQHSKKKSVTSAPSRASTTEIWGGCWAARDG
jgi:hypothetical protein